MTASAPEGRGDGRQWSGAGVAMTFPEGWVITTEHFAAGLSGTLLEGRNGDTQMALTWHAGELPGLHEASALDLLHLLAPVVMVRQDPSYSLERLPYCHDAVLRRFEGWTQFGLRVDGGLLLVQAWDQTDGLRELVCEHTRWTG